MTDQKEATLQLINKALEQEVPTKVLPDGSTAVVTEQSIVMAKALTAAKSYIEGLD